MPSAPRDRDAAARAGDQPAVPLRSEPDDSYPTDHVVGVIDTDEQLAAAVEALTRGGFLDSEITIDTGPASADRVRATTGRTGLAHLVIRIAEALGVENEEMAVKSYYEGELRRGHYVIEVLAPSEERKQRATQILREHGGHAINHMARFTIERLVPPRERVVPPRAD
ncbi:MAG TPA: hypothetical protein VF166_03480 [Gemmatimonadaceae bacterium]